MRGFGDEMISKKETQRRNDKAYRALKNVHAYALALLRSPGSVAMDSVAQNLVRFAEEGGVKSSILRDVDNG